MGPIPKAKFYDHKVPDENSEEYDTWKMWSVPDEDSEEVIGWKKSSGKSLVEKVVT